MAGLPREAVTEILLRLPVEPLLRFRCVSKPWLALIDSPDFIYLHLNRSIQTRNNRTLLVKTIGAVDNFSINLDDPLDDSSVETDHHPLEVFSPQQYPHPPQILGSCNGLLLLRFEHVDVSFCVICNPFTRKYHRLPTFQIESPHYLFHLDTYGLGYDCVHDDYKVVRMIQWDDEDDDDAFHSEVQVYSLKSNTWTRIQDFPYYILNRNYGVFSTGALHWVVSDAYQSRTSFVVAFDLATEEYGLLPMPNLVDENRYGKKVVALEGLICLVHNDWKESIDVWVMKNYRVGESWTKLLSFAFPKGDGGYHEFIIPLAFSKDGTQVLLKQTNNLIWVDLEDNLWKRIDVHGLPGKFSVEFVMQSLVPLGSGSETYVKELHGEK